METCTDGECVCACMRVCVRVRVCLHARVFVVCECAHVGMPVGVHVRMHAVLLCSTGSIPLCLLTLLHFRRGSESPFLLCQELPSHPLQPVHCGVEGRPREPGLHPQVC